MSLEGKGAIAGMLQLMGVELAWIGLHALAHSQQCDAVPMKNVNGRVSVILLMPFRPIWLMENRRISDSVNKYHRDCGPDLIHADHVTQPPMLKE